MVAHCRRFAPTLGHRRKYRAQAVIPANNQRPRSSRTSAVGTSQVTVASHWRMSTQLCSASPSYGAKGGSAVRHSLALAEARARGLDVLVEPEEVVRVVGRFDTGQAVVIDAVGVPDPVAALLTEVVDVHAVEVRAHGVEEFAGPSHVGWRVGGVVPLRQDQEVVVAAAMREGGRSRGDAAGRARDLLQADPGVR